VNSWKPTERFGELTQPISPTQQNDISPYLTTCGLNSDFWAHILDFTFIQQMKRNNLYEDENEEQSQEQFEYSQTLIQVFSNISFLLISISQ